MPPYCIGRVRVRRGLGLCRRGLVGEERVQVGADGGTRLYGKAEDERVERRIGQHVRRIEIEFAAPHQSRLLALLHNQLKEPAKDLQAVADTDAGEARMIRQRLIQIVAQKPPDTESVCYQAHEQAFRAHIFEDHDQLQLKEDDGIYAGSATGRIAVLDQVAHEREIEYPLHVAVEVVSGYQFVEGNGGAPA